MTQIPEQIIHEKFISHLYSYFDISVILLHALTIINYNTFLLNI